MSFSAEFTATVDAIVAKLVKYRDVRKIPAGAIIQAYGYDENGNLLTTDEHGVYVLDGALSTVLSRANSKPACDMVPRPA